MRHRKHRGRLGRNTAWRKATLKALANDIIKYQRIRTTLIKAKVLRSFVEPIITAAKNNLDSVNARRLAFKKLCDRETVKILFDKIAPLFKDTPGGYTRVMATGTRKGDGAEMAIMELTKRTISDDILLKGKEKKEKPKKVKTGEKTIKGQPEAKEDEASKEKEKPLKQDKKKTSAATIADHKDKKPEHGKMDVKKKFFDRFRRKTGE